MTGIPSTHHFILVHGASHGAWCWYKIRCLLENSGNKVSCVDLAGAGIHPTDPNTIFSFDEYNKPLIDLISALPEDETIILVGHSLGGLSVTQAIHKFGNKIRLAIYIAALMVRSGHSMEQDTKRRSPEDLEQKRKIFALNFGLGPQNPPTSVICRKEYQRECFYDMSPKEDSTLASMLLRPSPCRATGEVHFVEGAAVDSVKRVFIKTICDKIMHPDRQDKVINGWPPNQVLTIESDHSPFFSAPTQLFNLILKVQKELL
eukprot:TRINITY_DN15147_c0_g1_i1.p1 TRINITY_DN15147_c0_g1~~TRINITY_DN15147_c0_g1_i1.p1  ORF type:complete len:261 (+),score=15.47 TRINITY_DN15147_c0_g1_i1:87-869(+)